MMDLDRRALDAWITREPPEDLGDEVEIDMPDPCPICDWVGTHAEDCRRHPLFGLCARPMRDGPCLMQKNHRGRCSTRVFTCDACGKTRRSDPASAVYNQHDGIAEALICWFCVNVKE